MTASRRKGKRLSDEEVRARRDNLIAVLEGRYSRSVEEGEKMFRRSEAMRNRQVEIINRLQKGDDPKVVYTDLLMEIESLKAERDALADQLAGAKSEIVALKANVAEEQQEEIE
jgi:hypothetical protein